MQVCSYTLVFITPLLCNHPLLMQVCSYTLVFITPLLCNHPLLIAAAGGAGGKSAALAGPKGGARDFLSTLEGSCFYRRGGRMGGLISCNII